MNNKLIISSALAGLVALAGVSSPAAAQDKKVENEKCYGVAKKGMNDCGTATHSCAGKAAKDAMPEEWKYVPKGSCEAMKGSTKKPGAKADAKMDAKSEMAAPKN
jgi:uncharacterized membrane protein